MTNQNNIFTPIQDILNEMVDTQFAAGGNCLVFVDGNIQCYCESGFRDLENQLPIQRDTIFRLYSMSKPMTAAAVMILVQEGKIDLLAPVSDYIEEFANPQVCTPSGLRPAKREVGIQDLLNMTSGYTYEGTDNQTQKETGELIEQIKSRMEYENALSTIEIAKRLGKIPLSFDPGTEFLYGMSADILGAIIEVVSGQKFSDFLRDRIWNPLGMYDTGFYVPEEKQNRLATVYTHENGALKPFYQPHLGISNDMKNPPTFESGGAGLVSTLDDYLKFCRMLLNQGTLDGVQILSSNMVDFLTRTSITDKQRRGLDSWDSLGGYSYGNLMRIMTHPEQASTLASYGEYGWDGWLGPYMAVVPQKKMIILLMEQLTGAGTTSFTRRIRNIVFSNI